MRRKAYLHTQGWIAKQSFPNLGYHFWDKNSVKTRTRLKTGSAWSRSKRRPKHDSLAARAMLYFVEKVARLVKALEEESVCANRCAPERVKCP